MKYTIGSGIRAAVVMMGAFSAFDPEMFMNTSTTDANDTQFRPVSEGEYQAAIDTVTPRMAGDKPVLEVKWAVDSDQAREETGMDKPTVKQTIWLDLTPGGGLDSGKGKNVSLGKLREALGQNSPGRPWSPGMLVGQVAMIKVGHRTGSEPGQVFADVKAVAAL